MQVDNTISGIGNFNYITIETANKAYSKYMYTINIYYNPCMWACIQKSAMLNT